MKSIRCSSLKVFEDNFREFGTYIHAKRMNLPINNADRLIDLIERYYQILAYLKDQGSSGEFFQVKGIIYQIKISGTDSEGKKNVTSVLNSEAILNNIVTDLQPLLNPEIFERYISLHNVILRSTTIDTEHKYSLLNIRATLLEKEWDYFILRISDFISIEFLQLERKLYGRLIFDKGGIPIKYRENIKSDDVIRAYTHSLRTEIRIHIHNGKLVNIIQSLFINLESIIHGSNNSETTFKLTKQILTLIALNNNLFGTNSRTELYEKFFEYDFILPKEDLQSLRELLFFNPQQFELSNTCIRLDSPDFSSVNEEKIKTLVTFIVPHALTQQIEIRVDGAIIYFYDVKRLFDDSIFNMLDQIDLNINGLPLSYFSDALGNIGSCSRIEIEFDDFIHPDFVIVNGNYQEIDLSTERAKRGGVYLPFKDVIIDTLYKAVGDSAWPYNELKKANIDSNLISNLLIAYLDTSRSSNNLIHQVVHLITNYKSYIEARERYLQSISQHYFTDSSLEIRELVEKVEINSYPSFHRFCNKLLELVLRKVIEQGSGYKLFWVDGTTPKPEKDSQVAIYSLLRFITEIKGIKLIRESVASDGSVDFAFIYATNGNSLCICVELKNAHNQNLIHGIETQLPLYIADLGRKEGIFLVLWFKCASFGNPAMFESSTSLRDVLRNKKPKGYDINTIVIDCTKRLPPSNPKKNIS